jgi:prolipoprotein diacylglyceryltransferase
MFNGTERFFIEKIRVNAKFDFLGINMTQAELIAVLIYIGGATLFYFLKRSRANN